jgi:hypothetical protein
MVDEFKKTAYSNPFSFGLTGRYYAPKRAGHK